VRRHDSVTEPDLVVVLDPSLLAEESVAEGVEPDTDVIVNADGETSPVGGVPARTVPADRFGSGGAGFANVAMLGAVAAALGEPPLETLQDAIVETLGKKSSPDALRAAAAEGFAWLS
jgi:Pyruvate/2-oxoacid:ferredoxin oxidoreductase gamma subunit